MRGQKNLARSNFLIVSRGYSLQSWESSFRPPRREHALPGCVEGRCTKRLPFSEGGCHPPWFPPLHCRYYHHHRERQRTRPSSEQLRLEGLGRSMQRYHGNQTRRPPSLPTVHSTVGLRSAFAKMQRYFDNGNYPRQGHVHSFLSDPRRFFFIQTLPSV